MALEEMSFENVDDDGRMDDGPRMPDYTISSPMNFRLIRGTKKFDVLYQLANLRSSF